MFLLYETVASNNFMVINFVNFFFLFGNIINFVNGQGGGGPLEKVSEVKEKHVRNACLQIHRTTKHAPQMQGLLFANNARFVFSRCSSSSCCLLPPPLFSIFLIQNPSYGTVSIVLLGNCFFSLGSSLCKLH